MNQEIEQFETHMDRMEREAQAQRNALAIEQEKTKQKKIEAKKDSKETFLWFTAIIACVAVIVFLFGLWYVAMRGPGADAELRQEEITMCYSHDGKWEPDKGDYRDDDFVAEHCNLPGDGE